MLIFFTMEVTRHAYYSGTHAVRPYRATTTGDVARLIFPVCVPTAGAGTSRGLSQFFSHILRTNRAFLPIMSAGGAVGSSEIDHLKVYALPFFFRDQALEVAFCLDYALSIG